MYGERRKEYHSALHGSTLQRGSLQNFRIIFFSVCSLPSNDVSFLSKRGWGERECMGEGEKGGGEEVKGALPINTHIVGYSRLCVTGKLRIGLSNHINIHPRWTKSYGKPHVYPLVSDWLVVDSDICWGLFNNVCIFVKSLNSIALPLPPPLVIFIRFWLDTSQPVSQRIWTPLQTRLNSFFFLTSFASLIELCTFWH